MELEPELELDSGPLLVNVVARITIDDKTAVQWSLISPQRLTNKLKEDLLEPHSAQRSKFHRVQVCGCVSLACEARLVFWKGSTSLGRGGVLSELKAQFHSGRTPGCQRGSFADGMLSSKSWHFICSHRR